MPQELIDIMIMESMGWSWAEYQETPQILIDAIRVKGNIDKS